MRKLPFLLVLLFAACSSVRTERHDGHANPPGSYADPVQASGYDTALASKLGADDYGMKNYVLCFLKPGKQKLMMVSEVEALEANHLQYIHRLSEEGKLVLLGMFLGNPDIYTQLVFNTQDIAIADSIMRHDPKVKAEVVVPEFHHWYGPAALPELKPIHERISKKNHQPTGSK